MMILGALFVLLCLLVYYLFHVGNRYVGEGKKLQFTSKQVKLIFFILLGALAIGWLFRHSGILVSVLTPFIVAGVLAYAINPLIHYLMSKGLSRLMSVVLIFVSLIGMVAAFSIFFIPILVSEISSLIIVFPEISINWYERVSEWYRNTLGNQSATPDTLEDVLAYFNINFQSATGWLSQSAGGIISRVLSFATSLVHVVTIPVLMFYFMKDGDDIAEYAKKLVLPRSRRWVFPLVDDIDEVLGGFIRGQLLVALIIGVLSSIALLLLGIPYWLVLGILAGIGDLVPYVGPFLGALPAVFITLTTDPLKALWVVVAFIIVQQIESNLISPKIVGHSVGLHPAAIIFVLLLGGSLWGLVGLLVAVPLAGVLKVILENIIRWFQNHYPKSFTP
jgi:predicted PurR-regulated permease PerM